MFPKAILQSGSRKLIPKVAAESYSPKLRSKATPQRCSPFKAAVQSCRAKLLLKAAPAPQSCYPKLFPGASTQSCAPKLRFCKPVHQNGSPKPFCKAAPESCAPKLLYQKLLLKAAVQSYCPKTAILQTYTPKRLPKAILQSGSRKRLPKAAPESYYWKLLPEVVCIQLDRNFSSNKLRACRYILRLALLGAQQWTAMRSTARAPPQD